MIDLDLVRTRLPEFLRKPDPSVYNSNNFVVLDFETTTHGKGLALYPQNSLVLACWYNGKDHKRPGAHHQWGTEFDMQQLVEDCLAADFVVAHNAKFELQWLARCGLPYGKALVFDTQIAEYVRGGNRWQYGALSLDRCAKRWGFGQKDSIVNKMIKNGVSPADIPRGWLLRYCRQDVKLCASLMLKMRANMSDKLLRIVYTRCLATPVLAEIETRGLQLDEKMVRERALEVERSYAELQNELERIAGGINVNSSKQLQALLYDELGFKPPCDHRGRPLLTAKGAYKMDVATISKLRPTNKKQREFLAVYTAANDAYQELTKYLRKFVECLDNDDGKMLAQFNQTNTQTHRLSSSGLDYKTQFQNLPRAYKPFFRSSREGWRVGEADGAQLEFRVAAHLGRDTRALHDIEHGEDIHAFTAMTLTEAGQETNRQGAKEHTFKPLYGGTSGTNAEQTYYRAFREKYIGIDRAQKDWINVVLQYKELETEWGMQFYWPDTKLQQSGYITNTPSICNYPVQSLATAEIIPIALVYFWHYIQAAELCMYIVNTVHDSIITEQPPEEEEAFHQLSKVCLTDEVYFYLEEVYGVELTVPLGAGVTIGTNWADSEAKASEVVYNAEPSIYKRMN